VSSSTPRVYGPREKQLNVRLDEKAHERLALLCSHYGETKSQLIERLIDGAAEVAKREIAARTRPTQLPVIDDEDESGFRQPPQFTHDGTFIPPP